LLKLASAHDELDVLHLQKAEVDRWLDEWDIDVEERAAFCKSIADALVKAGQPCVSCFSVLCYPLMEIGSSKAYPYLLLRAQTLPSTSPNAEKALIEVIVDGLRLSSIFNFEPILSLPNITLVQEHRLFKLLKIFMGRSLAQYRAWIAEHEGELSKHGEPFGVITGLSES
jgi:translation initiation factor 3 subunit M